MDQLSGPLALVAYGEGGRAAPPDLAGDPVGVGDPGIPRLATILAQPLPGPAAAQALACRLLAYAHLEGGIGDRNARFYPGSQGLPPPRGEPYVRMLLHWKTPLLFV
ncbi:hypothetical protein COLINT_02572 [Collinsella intestinalis DSM 13280]|uniref:Uncharacterized protein n=1 Tax=Collinsella intestinalis DSM 13280 TaxID=521003 RepID=C4F942_9ACTN|nr:hypothetical protein COLINT_02572 [Collinsella intestinalis DSM 13280]